jgi:hypothetical protein
MPIDEGTGAAFGSAPSHELDVNHHVGFNRALQKALADIPDEWRGLELNVQLVVGIKPNPGSIGDYKAFLSPR